MKNKYALRSNLYALISVILLVAFDQWTKILATNGLKEKEPFHLWKDVFHLCYLENTGAAFGIFQGYQWIFLIVSALALVLFVAFYEKMPFTKRFRPLRIGVVLLISGAVGNMIDRFFLGYVVDFFHFVLIDFPVFNVADCFVCVSIAYFVILILFFYKEEDFSWKKS